jgi:TolB protein
MPISGGFRWRTVWRPGPPEQITSDPAAEFDPSISPDGKEVAFHSFRTGNRDIFIVPSSGGAAVQLTTSPEQDWNPRWSPDGKSIVFDQQLTGDSTLWVAHRRPDGSWEKPQALPHKGYAALAVWSPDGRSIAFSGLAVKVLDLNTGTERSLTDAPSTGTWISWSPDSRWIYYTREEPTRDSSSELSRPQAAHREP